MEERRRGRIKQSGLWSYHIPLKMDRTFADVRSIAYDGLDARAQAMFESNGWGAKICLGGDKAGLREHVRATPAV